MPVPVDVERLVERFERDLKSYRRQDYNETQARRELIDPLFMALGWDVDNRRGGPNREVIHEDKIHIQGKPKAPDYSFRLDGRRKFFVEAKKPAVDIQSGISAALQVRRYGWTARLLRSVLTDFEEFSVYDTTVRPTSADKPVVARVSYYTYADYIDKWDEIAGLFGREAVLDGSLDSLTVVKRAEPVDRAFLGEIERWRDLLARNIALRNPGLGERELNFAVQQTIDRIIFLRIAEDRGTEPYGRLRDIGKGDGTYERLRAIFMQADDRYNSGLFHFAAEKSRPNPDTLTPGLSIDDKVLKDILKNLYEPLSPYEFSVFPPEVLGQVYEQFLGKVIRLTDGGRAKVDEKPEVRKAGGVYYTPSYIVDYIVRQTVGKLVEGHAADPAGPVSRLRVLDPACGSGSFLLGAFQFLLDWHLQGYLQKADKWSKGRNAPLYRTADGELHLSLNERKRILLDNLYGVDIDAQAVEVTKLSLLLKVLEGSPEALGGQLSLFAERVLPDLERNIKCGNSLIGPDFYTQASLLDDRETARVNAFDWQTEFRDIMTAGGFDAVIGNPPYINIENIPVSDRQYLVSTYGEGGRLGKRYDIYQVFVMKGLELLRQGGVMGMILPNTFLMGSSYSILRQRLLQRTRILQCVDLPQGVFIGVTVDNVLLFVAAENDRDTRLANLIAVYKLDPRSDKSRISSLDWDDQFDIPQAIVLEEDGQKINLHANPIQRELFRKIERTSVRMGEVTDSSQGIILYKTSDDADRARYTGFEPKPGWGRLLRGKNIARYETKWGGEYVSYGDWLWCARDPKYFTRPKILLHAIRNKSLPRRLVGTLDFEGFYNAHNLANVIARDGSPFDLAYILGLFNSTLLNYWYRSHFPNVNINPSDFRQLPIRTIDFNDAADVARHDRMVELVEQMLELHRKQAAAALPHEKTLLTRQIEATDRAIDALVYELYGLTAEEIAIVEGA